MINKPAILNLDCINKILVFAGSGWIYFSLIFDKICSFLKKTSLVSDSMSAGIKRFVKNELEKFRTNCKIDWRLINYLIDWLGIHSIF